MRIVHIERPADLGSSAFEVFIPPPVGDLPRPTLGSVEAWAAPDGAVETGTWEATPGTFARAIIDAEFCHFVRGRATFVTEDGRRFEFKGRRCSVLSTPHSWHMDDSRDAAQDLLHLALTHRGRFGGIVRLPALDPELPVVTVGFRGAKFDVLTWIERF
jgi:hypothetical protein